MEQKKITVTLDSRERSVTAYYDKIPFESRTLLLTLKREAELKRQREKKRPKKPS